MTDQQNLPRKDFNSVVLQTEKRISVYKRLSAFIKDYIHNNLFSCSEEDELDRILNLLKEACSLEASYFAKARQDLDKSGGTPGAVIFLPNEEGVVRLKQDKREYARRLIMELVECKRYGESLRTSIEAITDTAKWQARHTIMLGKEDKEKVLEVKAMIDRHNTEILKAQEILENYVESFDAEDQKELKKVLALINPL